MPGFSNIRNGISAGALCGLYLFCQISAAQGNSVRAKAEVRRKDGGSSTRMSAGDVVLWLTPLNFLAEPDPPRNRLQLVQKNKSFQPHLLVVRVGSAVDFPNRDPFFHNVFSLFDGKRFDLGLYESGASNSVRFDRVGVSYLFCNIHPEMSAVVVAVDTPYYAISDRNGSLALRDVPDGKYQMHVWYEKSAPEDLKALTRSVTISSTQQDLGTIVVAENPNFSTSHKNKYGQDYAPPPAPDYSHP